MLKLAAAMDWNTPDIISGINLLLINKLNFHSLKNSFCYPRMHC
jgi:hypothetical protein